MFCLWIKIILFDLIFFIFIFLFVQYPIMWRILPHRWFFFSLSSSSPSVPLYRRHICRRFFFSFSFTSTACYERTRLRLHQNACRKFSSAYFNVIIYCLFTLIRVKKEKAHFYFFLDYSFKNNFQFRPNCAPYRILSLSRRMALKRINKELLELEKE
jgi:hypothetical protein